LHEGKLSDEKRKKSKRADKVYKKNYEKDSKKEGARLANRVGFLDALS